MRGLNFNSISLLTQFVNFLTGHPWVQVDGVAPDKPLDSAVLSRLKQFSAMNRLKKMALRVSPKVLDLYTIEGSSFTSYFLQVIAESMSEDEIAGLREMFKMIDADNSGQITFEELKAGLKRVGANLKESEIYDLMQAVIIRITKCLSKLYTFISFLSEFSN